MEINQSKPTANTKQIMVKKWGLSTKELTMVSLFAALIAIGAFLRIPVPVVPFTLQFLFTTMAGLLLGPQLGAISVGAYILLGLLGLPIFSQGGGPGYLFVPTFGYILGFCLGAWLTGTIAHRAESLSLCRLLAANFAGLGIVYLLGMVYYYVLCNFYLGTPIGVWPLLLYCFLLAVPGDAVLCFVAALLAKRMLPEMRRILG